MGRVAFLVAWLLSAGAWAACPGVVADCPAPTYKSVTAGTLSLSGAATLGAGGTFTGTFTGGTLNSTFNGTLGATTPNTGAFSSIGTGVTPGAFGTWQVLKNLSGPNLFNLIVQGTFSGNLTSDSGHLAYFLVPRDTAILGAGTSGPGTVITSLANYGNTAWTQSTSYVTGNAIDNGGKTYTETVASCTSLGSGTGPSGTGSGISDGTCSWNYVSSAWAGGRAAQSFAINVLSQSSSTDDQSRQLQPIYTFADAFASMGGSSPHSGLSAGFLYGGGAQAYLHSGATNWSGVVTWEDDVGLFTGASAAGRVGHQVISFKDLQGTEYDLGYNLGVNRNSAGTSFAPGFKNGYALTGVYPIDSNGAIMQYQPALGLGAAGFVDRPPQDKYGIDLNGILHSAASYRAAGAFVVDGAGAVSVGGVKLSVSGANANLDTPGSVAASAVVAVGGSGYQATDHLYDDYGGIWTVTLSGSVLTAVAQTAALSGINGSTPSNPITLNGGTGSGGTINITWTKTATLALGTTSATLVKIGSATADQILGSGAFLPALNTTAGFAHLPFTNASSGAGGIPTGTPANTSGPACEWNDVTFTLNCYSPSAGAWKHVTLSASAG